MRADVLSATFFSDSRTGHSQYIKAKKFVLLLIIMYNNIDIKFVKERCMNKNNQKKTLVPDRCRIPYGDFRHWSGIFDPDRKIHGQPTWKFRLCYFNFHRTGCHCTVKRMACTLRIRYAWTRRCKQSASRTWLCGSIPGRSRWSCI